jgi:hypothetical protein
MKYLFLLIAIAGAAFACNDIDQSNQNPVSASTGTGSKIDTTAFTSIQWIDSVKNFGQIAEGQQLAVAFRFKNTGNKPLIIRSVQPGCGCTVADPPKEPIAPGAEGVINGSFNSSGRVGANHKEIFVEANTTGTQRHTLVFDVQVAKKAE